MARNLKLDVGSEVMYIYNMSWGVGEVIGVPWSKYRRVKFYNDDGSVRMHNISVRRLKNAVGMDIGYRDNDDGKGLIDA